MKQWQKCIVCGAEFLPRNRCSVLCGNPECKKRREAEQKKAYEKRNPVVKVLRKKDIEHGAIMINETELEMLEDGYARALQQLTDDISGMNSLTLDWGNVEKMLGEMQNIVKRRAYLRMKFEDRQVRVSE